MLLGEKLFKMNNSLKITFSKLCLKFFIVIKHIILLKIYLDFISLYEKRLL